MEKLHINKNIILVTVILVGGCIDVFQGLPQDLDDLLLEEGRYLHPRTGKLYTGSAVKMAPEDDTRLVMDLNLLDGLFHGPYTIYDPELYYIAGPLRMDRGAIVIEEGMWESGRFDRGLKTGMVRISYGDGTLFRSVNHQTDKWHGTLLEFRKNGELTLQASFVNDEMHGFFESYWLNDEILRSGYYDRGKRCGTWFDYGNNNEYDSCPEKFRVDS
ncbi:MAG: hypothetical protein ABGX31_05130 [bacterium]|jgi:hypothetical protein